MPSPNDIIDIEELIGRTIVKASTWGDGSSMSLVLDNGGILQITAMHAREDEVELDSMGNPLDGGPIEDNPDEPYLHYEIEFPTQPYDHADKSIDEFMQFWKAHPEYESFGVAQEAWMNYGGDAFDNGFKKGDL